MELHSVNIPTPRTTGDPPILIMPIGDIQYAGKDSSTAMEMLKRHVAWGVEQNAYFLGMGDYIDFASPSNRLRLRQAALYDTALKTLSDVSVHLVTELYQEALKGSEGRWLGLLEGHHFYQMEDGTTTDQLLCRLLKTRFLGTSAYVRLVFHHGQTVKTQRHGNVLIWCHHGAGYGQRSSAPLNRLDQLLTYWDADIYLMGHQSKKVTAPIDRIEPAWSGPGGPRLVHRTKLLACTGSFSRAYLVGSTHGHVPRGDYVEQKMLSPTSLGGVVIRIAPRGVRGEQQAAGETMWLPDISAEV